MITPFQRLSAKSGASDDFTMLAAQDNHLNSWGERLESFPLLHCGDDGYEFSYRHRRSEIEDYPTIIFLHGIGSASASWVKQFESFDGRFQLIAWDMPGYGRSAPLATSQPSADDYAAALQYFLATLDIKRPILLGHSLGALVATAYAKLWPDSLSGLFLANPALGYGHMNADAQSEKLSARMTMFDRLGAAGLAQERGAKLLSDEADEEDIALVRYNMSRLHHDGYRAAGGMLMTGKALFDAAHYSEPVSVICGDKDNITPPDGARGLAAAFPAGNFTLLPNAGHASYIEQPHAFGAALFNYIESLHDIAAGEIG